MEYALPFAILATIMITRILLLGCLSLALAATRLSAQDMALSQLLIEGEDWKVLADGLEDPRYAPPRPLRELVAAGHLGQKTGRGFHAYPRP